MHLLLTLSFRTSYCGRRKQDNGWCKNCLPSSQQFVDLTKNIVGARQAIAFFTIKKRPLSSIFILRIVFAGIRVYALNLIASVSTTTTYHAKYCPSTVSELLHEFFYRVMKNLLYAFAVRLSSLTNM